MAKTIYSAGKGQKLMLKLNDSIERIFTPARVVNIFTLAKEIAEFIHELKKQEKPTKDNVDKHNSKIWIDCRDQVLQHAKANGSIFEFGVNYMIAKCDYDEYYEHFRDKVLLFLSKSDYQYPNHSNPSPQVWDVIPMPIKERLVTSVRSNYQLLLERLETINDTLEGQEAETNKTSRHEQFVNRILKDFEREVLMWKV